jgi:glycosyltransferase involved in cell wall biosynthesis
MPCLNGAETIAVQLEALAKQSWYEPWEIIFSDNGSTDETLSVLDRYKERLPNLRIVDASARRGQPYALNVGAAAATGDVFLFCDADDEVGSGWLTAMGQALLKHDFVACRLDSQKLNEPWLQATRSGQRDGLQRMRYPPYLPHGGGGTLGVKRWIFEAVGGFDEELAAIHDTYFCLRVQLAGIPLHFVPEALVHIRYRHTFRGMYRQARGFGCYSVLMYKKGLVLGLPKIPHPWEECSEAWRILLRAMLQIRSRGELGACVFNLGYRMGRLKGSIKHRVLAI